MPNMAHWGNDYVAIEFPMLGDAATIRLVSDSMGNFNAVLPVNQQYHIVVFDPKTGLIANGYGITAASGNTTDLTSTLVFAASTATDSNGDGLPDDVKFAIGASTVKSDSNGDGIDDFTALQLGLNPVSGVGFPTGVVSASNLNGTAQAVAVTGSATDLYRALWHRKSANALTVDGDRGVLDLFLDRVHVRWS